MAPTKRRQRHFHIRFHVPLTSQRIHSHTHKHTPLHSMQLLPCQGERSPRTSGTLTSFSFDQHFFLFFFIFFDFTSQHNQPNQHSYNQLTMSWQTYIDTSLLGTGNVSAGCILGRADGAVYAASAGYGVRTIMFLAHSCCKFSLWDGWLRVQWFSPWW